MTTLTLVEKKEELETLYNQLLMQHESLPSEIHKHWNNEAMNTIDAGLMKIEKELTITIETPEMESENVDGLSESFFYLEKELFNKKNHYETVINEVSRTNKNEVVIRSKVNVDDETIFTFRNVYVETTYNIKTGKMKSKATDYNHRKDVVPAKQQIEEFISHLLTQKMEYKEDISEAKHLTTMYYYNLLKQKGYDYKTTNELDVMVSFQDKTVREVHTWYSEQNKTA